MVSGLSGVTPKGASLKVSSEIMKEKASGSSSERRHSKLSRKRESQLRDLDNWVPKECCKRLCVENVGTEHCRALRGLFLGIPRDERKMELGALVKNCEGFDEKERFFINSVVVCNRFLVDTLCVSRTLISNVLGLPSANASRLAGRNGGTEGSTSKKSGIMSFLRILADEICDEIPNKSERHLPHGNKRLVYLLYQDNELRYGRESSRESFFTRYGSSSCHM